MNPEDKDLTLGSGGGQNSNEYAERFKAKYSLFNMEYDPANPDRPDGLFKLEDIDIRLDVPDWRKRNFGYTDAQKVDHPPDPAAIHDVIVFTFLFVNQETDEPIVNKADGNKPFALEFEINRPSDKISWGYFLNTTYYKMFKSIGFEIKQGEQYGLLLNALKTNNFGLYSMFQIEMKNTKGGNGREVRQYPKIIGNQIWKPMTKKHFAKNAELFDKLREAIKPA